MATQANGDNLLLGRGKWYFARQRIDLTFAPYRAIGEVSKGEVNPTTQKKDKYTMTNPTSAKIAENVTQQTHTIALELGEFTKDNLAIGLLGVPSNFTQASGSASAEDLWNQAASSAPDMVPDLILQTAQRNISAQVLTVHPASGSDVTLALGTDYEVEDASLGLIRMLAAGVTKVLAGASPNNLLAAYTAGAANLIQIAAGQTTQITGKLLFIGNPVEGPVIELEAWKARIEPSAAIALLSDDYANIALSVEVLDDSANHPDSPLYTVTYR